MRSVSVLVVEDDEIWQQIIEETLQSLDCHVDVASNCQAAIKKLDAHPYDMVTLDMALSQEEEKLTVTASGGWRLLVYKLARYFPGTFIFVISASFKDQLERVFELNKEYGVRGFTTKIHFDPNILEDWVREVQEFKEAGGRPDVTTQELLSIYRSRPDITTQKLLDLYEQQLAIQKKNKAQSELQKAKLGLLAPPMFDHTIRQCEEEIERIEAEIAALSR